MRFTSYREVEAPDIGFLREVAGDVVALEHEKSDGDAAGDSRISTGKSARHIVPPHG